ncbi:MAG: hypothetical protein J0L81_10190 [Caulobacterales bacterium]|jgi:hypothetical protein|nr:hypothetical protein [Caulobacterales bacterium]
MSRASFAMLGLAFAAAACSGSRPPEELSGLWSAGPAACAAGVGVRFGADAIEVVYESQVETLFDRPRYELEETGDRFRVRILYDLPRQAGGAGHASAHGVIVLARHEDGTVAPELHTLVDGRTGAARTRIVDDPAVTALTLQPCGAHPWSGGLRGRSQT